MANAPNKPEPGATHFGGDLESYESRSDREFEKMRLKAIAKGVSNFVGRMQAPMPLTIQKDYSALAHLRGGDAR